MQVCLQLQARHCSSIVALKCSHELLHQQHLRALLGGVHGALLLAVRNFSNAHQQTGLLEIVMMHTASGCTVTILCQNIMQGC